MKENLNFNCIYKIKNKKVLIILLIFYRVWLNVRKMWAVPGIWIIALYNKEEEDME